MAGIVIVATDFSPSAREAIGHAARIASHRGAALHALTVVDSDHINAMASSLKLSREEVGLQVTQRTLMMLGNELKDAGHENAAQLHVATGRPVDEIDNLCERLGAGLLVLGYQGKSERGRGPGTVASRCVRNAPCDVLLTRRGHPDAFGLVVAGVDFTDSTDLVIGAARSAVNPDGGRLVLLHAHANPFDALSYTGLGYDDPTTYDDFTESFRRDLEKAAERLQADSPGETVSAQVLVNAHHGRAIAAWCTDQKADLVVVGTRRKPGLRYWLLGSTAEYILKETECAVMAVRGPT